MKKNDTQTGNAADDEDFFNLHTRAPFFKFETIGCLYITIFTQPKKRALVPIRGGLNVMLSEVAANLVIHLLKPFAPFVRGAMFHWE
jgi:hypothetical protein